MMLDFGDYFRKAAKFVVVGAIGSVVNLGLLYFFTRYLGIWYIYSEIIAILVAFAVNFNGNILAKNIKISKVPEVKPAPLKTGPPLKSEDLTE